MVASKRSTYELKKLADWWFDLSKLSLGSIAIPILSGELAGLSRFVFGTGGLIGFIGCANIGLSFARLVRE